MTIPNELFKVANARADKYEKILKLLTENAWLTYAEIEKKTGIPKTTAFDYVQIIKKKYKAILVKK
jgi:DNA-binding Lrp family transcriptional regulator